MPKIAAEDKDSNPGWLQKSPALNFQQKKQHMNPERGSFKVVDIYGIDINGIDTCAILGI